MRIEKSFVCFVSAVLSIFVAFSGISSALGPQGSHLIESTGSVSYQSHSLTYLHTEGRYIKNEFGETVYLRGCAKMCMQFVANPDPGSYNVRESDFQNIKDLLGVNVVRIDLALSLLFPTMDITAPDSVYLGHVDDIVSWCTDLGMYVLLDCHGYYSQMGAPDDFWSAPYGGIRNPYRNIIRDFWVFIAHRYLGNPSVFGFDLYNEPWNAVPTVDRPTPYEWKPQVEEWIDAITAVNPNLVFVVENAGHQMWGSNDWRWTLTDPVNRTNVVYSPHFYPQSAHGQWGDYAWMGLPGNTFANDYSNNNYASAKSEMETFLYALYPMAEDHPLLIGEFGSSNDEEGLQFLRDFLGFCNGNGWSWTYWAWVGRPQPSYNLVEEDWVTLTLQGNVVKGYT